MKPKPKEIPFKQWCGEEATRLGISVHAVHSRVYNGKYPHLKLRRVNSRVVFVILP